MRLFAPRVGDARTPSLTRQPRPRAQEIARGGEPRATPRGDQMLRRSFAPRTIVRVSKPSFGKEESLPHARQDRQASSVRRPLEGRQRPKKPGPSLLQVASPVGRGAPVCLRLPVFRGRLTGLLSRSPPTDTRPQARAYWASYHLGESFPNASGFLGATQSFSAPSHICYN